MLYRISIPRKKILKYLITIKILYRGIMVLLYKEESMPHIRIRGMKEAEVIKVSRDLIDDLVTIIDSPRDHFTLEYIPSLYIFDGEKDGNMYPFVEVLWFSREALKTQVARAITKRLKPFNYSDVTVYFENLEPKRYYENGDHF